MGASHRCRLAWWRDELRSQRRRRRQDCPLPSRNAPPRTTCPEALPKGGPRRLIVGTKENGRDDFGEFRRDIPEPARQCRPGNAGSIRSGAHCTTVERQCFPGRPVPGHAQLPAHERMPHHATLGGLPIRRTTGKAAEFGIGQSMSGDISPLALWGVLPRDGNAVLARRPHHASARSRILRINVTRQPRNSGILSGDSQARRRPRGLGPALPRSQTPSEPFAS